MNIVWLIRRWVGSVLVAISGLTATVGEAGKAAGRLLGRLFRR